MSPLFQKLLGVFWKRSQSVSSAKPHEALTAERISDRLHPRPIQRLAPADTSDAEAARLVVDAEGSTPPPEFEFASVDAGDDGHRLLNELDLTNVTNDDIDVTAGEERLNSLPSVVVMEPEPALVAVEEIVSADEEDKSLASEAPAVEQLLQPVSEAHASAETLEKFYALMHRHFGDDKPEAEPETADVLKILKLDRRELMSTPSSVSLPVSVSAPAQVVKTGTVHPGPVSLTEMHPDPGMTIEPAVVGETDVIDEDHASIFWTKRSVEDVLLEGDCSVRLLNCIAANRDFFSRWTIDRVITYRSEFTAKLMKLRNLGRKTANEVLDTLEAFARDAGIREGSSGVKENEHVPVDPLSVLDQAKLDTPITKALRSSHITTRLANLLETGGIDDITVRDFILHPDHVRTRMVGCKNAGRKTVAEAFELLSTHVATLWHADSGIASVQAEDEPPEGLTTREWIEQEMSALPANRVQVLRSRYGLDGHHPMTLQQIAETVHVTRERVRQVEAKAIKHLRASLRSRAAFARYLADVRDPQWTILFGAQSTIPEDEVSERFRRLDPWFLLSIDILFEDGCDGYLSANAYKSGKSWFRSSDEADQRQKLDHVMDDILDAYRTPMPLDTFEQLVPSVRASLLDQGDKWVQRGGYIYTGYVGSKARRTGHMHAVARRIAQSGVFDIGTLIIEYRSAFPEDECGTRMFTMQADEAPHLFAPLFDGIWLCLDHTSCRVDRLSAPPFERRRVEETRFSEGSLGDLLLKRLAQSGPQRTIDLRRMIMDSARGSFSESSVGAVLLSYPCFRRAAPGIFELYNEGSEISVALDAHLLGDRHCRLYCHARHSGAPQDYYPLWNAGYEMRLAAWAQRHASIDLYRSLLAIIDPETWPADPDTIAEFQELRSRDGRWEIGAERRLPLGYRFLDSEQFLSALTHLVVFGWISWIGVNRSTGSKHDNHDAADVLAFFVMTGLVEPERNWQAPHHPTDLAKRLFLECKLERHVHGNKLVGDKDVFGRLRSVLYESPPTASQGWVDIEEFTAAMPAWQFEGIRMGKAYGGTQPRQPAINAEESFESDDWDAVFGG